MVELGYDKTNPHEISPGLDTSDTDAPQYESFVLKVHENCNIACETCYVYASPDALSRTGGAGMARPVIKQSARRIAEYAAQHKILDTHVVFHGGEPTLLPPDDLAFAAESVYAAFQTYAPKSAAHLGMQTNGIRLGKDSRYAEVCTDYAIGVGISLDGGRAQNDLLRLDVRGRSTYDDAMAGIAMMSQEPYKQHLRGVAAVIDLRNNPRETYEGLADTGAPRLDFLLPHANWHDLPRGYETIEGRQQALYANWMKTPFDMWYDDGRKIPIRLFQSMINVVLGKRSLVEGLGPEPVASMVINYKGEIEQVDTMRSTYKGAVHTGLNVWRHSIGEAAAVIQDQKRALGATALAGVCKTCIFSGSCAGGLETHRYGLDASDEPSFSKPSVYSRDLAAMLAHVTQKITNQAGAEAVLLNAYEANRGQYERSGGLF